MAKTDITGIVLAGGKSRRMGRDKALMVYQDKPLIQHAVDTLRQVCNKVVISSNKNDYYFTGCEVWPDEIDIHAPMIGIYSCLKRSPDEVNLVLSCDMPLTGIAILKYLLAKHNAYEIVVPRYNNEFIEPLCALYKRSVIPVMERFIKDRNYSMQEFIRASSHLMLEVIPKLDFYRDNMFTNINNPGDYGWLIG